MKKMLTGYKELSLDTNDFWKKIELLDYCQEEGKDPFVKIKAGVETKTLSIGREKYELDGKPMNSVRVIKNLCAALTENEQKVLENHMDFFLKNLARASKELTFFTESGKKKKILSLLQKHLKIEIKEIHRVEERGERVHFKAIVGTVNDSQEYQVDFSEENWVYLMFKTPQGALMGKTARDRIIPLLKREIEKEEGSQELKVLLKDQNISLEILLEKCFKIELEKQDAYRIAKLFN